MYYRMYFKALIGAMCVCSVIIVTNYKQNQVAVDEIKDVLKSAILIIIYDLLILIH
jgi:hypothetical protein